MFRPLTYRQVLIAALLVGLVTLASAAWAYEGFSGGHWYGGDSYYGHGYYGGHSYYSPNYYGQAYTPSWQSYAWPYGYGATAYAGTPYPAAHSYPTAYSFPATSSHSAWGPWRSGGGCR